MDAEEPSSSADAAAAPMLHVLHVADGDFFDRFGSMFRQLGLGLYSEGVRSSLLTDDGQAVRDLEGTPVDVRYVRSLSGWRAWRLGAYLAGQFRPPPALVHLWGTRCQRALADWTQPTHTSLLVHMTSSRDVGRLCRRGVRANQYVAAACARFRDELLERWPLLAEAVHLIPPALLIPEQVPALSGGQRTIGVMWAGTCDEDSGLPLLIDAVAQLRRKDGDLQVVLIGTGPAERAVWQAIQERGVADCVSLIDEPEIWERALGGVDVCIVPARQVELSLVPLAAMALGKIVIASRDQTAEWFVEDRTAWQFTPGSVVELAYHLGRAAGGHPDGQALSRSASAYAREHHSITRLVGQLTTVYGRIAPGVSGSAGGGSTGGSRS